MGVGQWSKASNVSTHTLMGHSTTKFSRMNARPTQNAHANRPQIHAIPQKKATVARVWFARMRLVMLNDARKEASQDRTGCSIHGSWSDAESGNAISCGTGGSGVSTRTGNGP